MSIATAPKGQAHPAPGNGRAGVEPFPDLIDRPLAPIELAKPVKKSGKGKVALLVLGLLLAVGVATAVVYWIGSQGFESTDDATVEGRVIPISPQIAARVEAVRINDNEMVRKGDLLVELDPTDYQVAVDQAKASELAAAGKLAEARANVDSAKAARDEATAAVAIADANASSAQSDYNRYLEASRSNAGAISRQQMDAVTASWRSTAAQVQEARAKLAAAEAQIATSDAAVASAQAELQRAAADSHRAQVNLSYCQIKAPEDGRITRKNIEPGSYVQAGQSLFAIVPNEFWIVANFKETQLDRMRAGQSVKIRIDAYPEREFTGKVDSIQAGTGARFSMLPAENATGNFVKVVQRIPVKILLDAGAADADHPLAAGMSAVPQVQVK